MARKPLNVDKKPLNCSVKAEVKDMLVAKAATTGQSISELVEVATVEKYSPHRGLASRLKALRADAKHRLEQELNKAQSDYDFVMQQCDNEWSNSFQKQLMDLCQNKLSSQDECNKLNRWLWDQGIWCLADDRSRLSNDMLPHPRYFGGRLGKAIHKVVTSPLYPSLEVAVDVCAELTRWVCPLEYKEFLLQHYDFSNEKLYEAFDSKKDSEEYSRLLSLMSQADEIYGIDLARVCRGC